MFKLNLIDVTVMIQVRKRAITASQIEHRARLREIHERNLNRRAEIQSFG